MTVRDLLRYAVSRLSRAGLAFGHGSADAYDEAAYLVLWAVDLPLERLEPFLDARLLPSERARALDLIERRVRERKPAAYLTGEAWISDLRFLVDERVIVPRSFIGEWLQQDISAFVPEPDRIARVLDLCTGSGCLAIVAAHAFQNAAVDAVDVSSPALEVAKLNVAAHGFASRITLRHGDLFSPVTGMRYDLILSNPPYVTARAMQVLPMEYRHEPALALAGGEDGLDFVRRILAQADRYLTANGQLVVETGHARPVVEAAFPRLPFTWIETAAGDDAMFVLSRKDLLRAAGQGRPGGGRRRAGRD